MNILLRQAADIVAKYNSKISGLGKAVDLLETQKGFFICIVLPLILFFLYKLYHFIKVLVTVKQEKAGLSKEDEEELKKKAVEEYLAKQKEEQEASEEK
jgi:signal peptidase